MRAKLLTKIKQTYPALMDGVADIKIDQLHDGQYFATLEKSDIMGNRYITFTNAADFKARCRQKEATIVNKECF